MYLRRIPVSLWVVLEGIWIRSETVNIAGYQMRLLVWRVVNRTLKFGLTFLMMFTITFPLTATRREKRQGMKLYLVKKQNRLVSAT